MKTDSKAQPSSARTVQRSITDVCHGLSCWERGQVRLKLFQGWSYTGFNPSSVPSTQHSAWSLPGQVVITVLSPSIQPASPWTPQSMSPQSPSLCLSPFELDFLSWGNKRFLLFLLILIFLRHYCLFYLLQLIVTAKVSCSWYKHFCKYYSVLRNQGSLCSGTAWKNLEDITLSGISHSQKDKCCVIPLM